MSNNLVLLIRFCVITLYFVCLNFVSIHHAIILNMFYFGAVTELFSLIHSNFCLVFKEVCYGKYGCFSKAPPFDERLVMSPQDPSIVNTTFSLYTRSNKHKAHLIDDEDEEKLYDSNFEISKRTIIISHGWTGTKEVHSQFLPFVHKQLLPKTPHGGERKTDHLKTGRTTNHAECKSLFFLSVFA